MGVLWGFWGFVLKEVKKGKGSPIHLGNAREKQKVISITMMYTSNTLSFCTSINASIKLRLPKRVKTGLMFNSVSEL